MNPVHVLRVLRRIWRVLDASERRRITRVAPFLVFSALFEIVGVAAVIPFLAAFADPGSVANFPIMGDLIRFVGVQSASGILKGAGLVLAVAVITANLVLLVTQWWMLRFTYNLSHALSARLLRHYLSQPYTFFLNNNTATLQQRVLSESELLVIRGVRSALDILSRSVVMLAIVGFLVVLDPRMAVITFGVLAGAYAFFFLGVRRYVTRASQRVVAANAGRYKAASDALGGIKDLRMAGREHGAWVQFLQPSQRFGRIQARTSTIAGLPRYAIEGVAVAGLVIITSFSSGPADTSVGALPLIGAYAFAGLRLLPAMQAMFSALFTLRYASGSLDVIEADLNLTGSLEPLSDSPTTPLTMASSIELRGIKFRYPSGEDLALKGVDLTLERDRSLAIVGRTGSGKTTLVDVLLGLHTPSEGTVLVDGVPVDASNMRAYRALFGYVPQFIYLLDDTVARNVAFGIPEHEVDVAAVKRACEQAQIADFIEGELAQGYQTIVGERGVRLSGGQRQRIGIARALYHQPQVLVFDEATSALDVHTEQAVYRALESIAQERTVVTVAHRLETVERANRVIVMDAGRVIDQGPAAEVLSRYRGEALVAD